MDYNRTRCGKIITLSLSPPEKESRRVVCTRHEHISLSLKAFMQSESAKRREK